MRIYWLNGALTIEPEGEKERVLINSLMSTLKYEPPIKETVGCGQIELANLPLEVIAGSNEGSPGRLSGIPVHHYPNLGGQ